MDKNSQEYIAFKKEQKIIFDKMMGEFQKAEELDTEIKGRDGPGTAAHKEAVRRYNKALKELKLKYRLD